jgi:hypothetical protein
LHDIVVRYALGDQAGLQRELDSLQRSGDQTFRVWGLGSQAGLALLHGRLADADRLLREQSAIAPPTAARRLGDAIYRATMDAWFHGPSPNAVRALDTALADVPLQRIPVADRPYSLAATAYAVAGDPDKAASIVAQYRHDVTDTARLRLDGPALVNTLGVIALMRGDAKTAVDDFRRGDVAADGLPARECAPCVHFALGRAFDAAGQPDSTIAEYEMYISKPYWDKLFGGENAEIGFGDAMVLAGIHKRLGELYEAKGDRQRAALHYAAFVALWKNADPELQPQVDDVRRRLARLGDTEGATRN